MSLKLLGFGLNLYQKCSRGVSQVRYLRTVDMGKHVGAYPTIHQLTAKLADVMGIEMGYKTIPKSREHLQNLIPKSQKELPSRTMKDSFTVGVIPLGSDTILQEKYVSLTGQVRVSRFLEDMDIFSVVVAQKYLLNPKVKSGMHSPYTIVTALVDRIEFTGYIPKVTEDVRISGHVSWTGKTSMEVIVWLDQSSFGDWHRITKAVFLLAIRDAINSKSALINPLIAENENEQAIMKGGEKRRCHRLQSQNDNLSIIPPTVQEQKVIHDLYKRSISSSSSAFKTFTLPDGCIWMEECVLSNVVHAHPQNRNLHNTVFGGFLMRQATELSYTLGLLFSKFQVNLKCISDIQFNYPVSMTAILKMHAYLVFTEASYMQILVHAETWEMAKDLRMKTNTFHLTYEVPETLPQLVPKTYHEAMMYIDGSRHYALYEQDNPFTFEPITTYEPSKNNSFLHKE